MARSKLFQKAVNSLSEAENRSLESFFRLMTNNGTDGSFNAIYANVEIESHLVGPGPWGNPASMAEFLKDLASTAPNTVLDAQQLFSKVCENHEGKGLSIADVWLPTELIRYSTNSGLINKLAEAFLGVTVVVDLDAKRKTYEEVMREVSSRWDTSRIPASCFLGGGKLVWTTFDDADAPISRTSAQEIAEALALACLLKPREPGTFLFEMRFSKTSVSGFRFPTVADAGTIPLFEPATELEANPAVPKSLTGRTRPLGPQAPQREVLHENARLSICAGAPIYIGEVH